MQKKFRIGSILIVMLSLLSACSGGQDIDPCLVFNAIYLNKSDSLTKETTREIVAHNETGEKLCEWKPV